MSLPRLELHDILPRMLMKQEWLGLMFDGADTVAQLVDGITAAVAISYAREGGTRTDSADRERTRICIELVRVMRGDMQWSVSRIIDSLPDAICKRLRGEDWEPEKNPAWAGGNSRLVVDPSKLRHALPD